MREQTYTLIQLDDHYRLVNTLHKDYLGYWCKENRLVNMPTKNITYDNLVKLYKNFYTTIDYKMIFLDIEYDTLMALNIVDKETGEIHFEYLVNDKQTSLLQNYLEKHSLSKERLNTLDIVTLLLYIFSKHYNALRLLIENNGLQKAKDEIKRNIKEYENNRDKNRKDTLGMTEKKFETMKSFHKDIQKQTSNGLHTEIDMDRFDIYNEYLGGEDGSFMSFAPYREKNIEEQDPTITTANVTEKTHIFLVWNKILRNVKVIHIGKGFLNDITEKLEPLYMEMDFNSDLRIFKHVKIADNRFNEFRDYIESEEDITEEMIEDIIKEFQGIVVINSFTLKRYIQAIYDLSDNKFDAIKFTDILNTLTNNLGIQKNSNDIEHKEKYKTLKLLLPYVMNELGLNKKRMNDGMYWYGLKEKFHGSVPLYMKMEKNTMNMGQQEGITNPQEVYNEAKEKILKFRDLIGKDMEYNNVFKPELFTKDIDTDTMKLKEDNFIDKKTFYENILKNKHDLYMKNIIEDEKIYVYLYKSKKVIEYIEKQYAETYTNGKDKQDYSTYNPNTIQQEIISLSEEKEKNSIYDILMEEQTEEDTKNETLQMLLKELKEYNTNLNTRYLWKNKDEKKNGIMEEAPYHNEYFEYVKYDKNETSKNDKEINNSITEKYVSIDDAYNNKSPFTENLEDLDKRNREAIEQYKEEYNTKFEKYSNDILKTYSEKFKPYNEYLKSINVVTYVSYKVRINSIMPCADISLYDVIQSKYMKFICDNMNKETAIGVKNIDEIVETIKQYVFLIKNEKRTKIGGSCSRKKGVKKCDT